MSQLRDVTAVSLSDVSVFGQPEDSSKEALIQSRALGRAFEEVNGDSEELFRCIGDAFHFELLHRLVSATGELTSGYAETLTAIHRALKKIPFAKTGLVSLLRSDTAHLKSHTDILSAATRVRADARALRETVRITQSVDSALIQDGFSIEYELIVLSREGRVAILHAARSAELAEERCYVWCVEGWEIEDLIAPHSGVLGTPHERMINLVHGDAADVQQHLLSLLKMESDRFLEATRSYDAREDQEIPHLVDMKRVTSIRAFISRRDVCRFADVAALEVVGCRTVQFLADFARHLFGCEISFEDIAGSMLSGRTTRVSSERVSLAYRILDLFQKNCAQEQIPAVVARRCRERVERLKTLVDQRAAGVSRARRKSQGKRKTRKIAQTERVSEKFAGLGSVATQQEMLSEGPDYLLGSAVGDAEVRKRRNPGLRGTDHESNSRNSESNSRNSATPRRSSGTAGQEESAQVAPETRPISPIRRKTVKISVDQLALF